MDCFKQILQETYDAITDMAKIVVAINIGWCMNNVQE